MARVQAAVWAPRFELSGLPRRDRKGCQYNAYLPDHLAGRNFVLNSQDAADVGDAEIAIARLNERANALANTEALARLLLRAESVASSRIEGLQVSADRLLRADVASQLGEKITDVTAAEVLSNIDAMKAALDALHSGGEITLDTILNAHRRLFKDSSLAEHGGKLRTQQNWIGGNAYNPCDADFIPPPFEAVPGLMADLISFCNGDAQSPIVQAAMAHAQFETIHPFVDGNGRIGRILIHLILRRRGLTVRISPPISLILATLAKSYVLGLTKTRYVGEPDSSAAIEGINVWISTFAAASTRAVADAGEFERRIATLQRQWRTRLGDIRKNSALDILVSQLPGAPIATVRTLAALTGRSFQAVNEAIERLLAAGVVMPAVVGAKRNRAFQAPEVIREFNALERRLSSPIGDTRTERPSRPVPKRRK